MKNKQIAPAEPKLTDLYQQLAERAGTASQPKQLEKENIAIKLQNQNIWENLKQNKLFRDVIEQYETVLEEIKELQNKMAELEERELALMDMLEDIQLMSDSESEETIESKMNNFKFKLDIVRQQIENYRDIKDRKQKSLLSYWKMMGVTESIVGVNNKNNEAEASTGILDLLNKMASTANTAVNQMAPAKPPQQDGEIIEVETPEKPESTITNFLNKLN